MFVSAMTDEEALQRVWRLVRKARQTADMVSQTGMRPRRDGTRKSVAQYHERAREYLDDAEAMMRLLEMVQSTPSSDGITTDPN